MRALSLHQPWASLVAVGAKRVETRSWQTRYRGPLAIHAAQRYPRSMLSGLEPATVALMHNALYGSPFGLTEPRGCIVATCRLVDCCVIGSHFTSGGRVPIVQGRDVSQQEEAFGDYSPGRWAWMLADVVALKEPIPARGQQGLWDWCPPEEPQG